MNTILTASNLMLDTKNDKAYFIGVKELSTNRYSSPITKELPFNSLKKLFTPINDVNYNVNINMLQCLDGYVSDIRKFITEKNDWLFRQFVQYNHDGVMRTFDNDFTRIKDGKLSEESPLYIELEKLLSFYKKEFLEVRSCYFRTEFDDKGSNINLLEKKLHTCIMILMISIFMQFHRKDNKKYFAENRQYSKDLTDIKRHLVGMIGQNDLYQLLTYRVCVKKDLTLLNKYNIIQNQNITELSLYRAINFNYFWNEKTSSDHYDFICNYRYGYIDENYYSQLLDLLNLVNKVEFIYQGLIESCLKEDGSENPYIKEICLFIENKDDLSNLNTALLSW